MVNSVELLAHFSGVYELEIFHDIDQKELVSLRELVSDDGFELLPESLSKLQIWLRVDIFFHFLLSFFVESYFLWMLLLRLFVSDDVLLVMQVPKNFGRLALCLQLLRILVDVWLEMVYRARLRVSAAPSIQVAQVIFGWSPRLKFSHTLIVFIFFVILLGLVFLTFLLVMDSVVVSIEKVLNLHVSSARRTPYWAHSSHSWTVYFIIVKRPRRPEISIVTGDSTVGCSAIRACPWEHRRSAALGTCLPDLFALATHKLHLSHVLVHLVALLDDLVSPLIFLAQVLHLLIVKVSSLASFRFGAFGVTLWSHPHILLKVLRNHRSKGAISIQVFLFLSNPCRPLHFEFVLFVPLIIFEPFELLVVDCFDLVLPVFIVLLLVEVLGLVELVNSIYFSKWHSTFWLASDIFVHFVVEVLVWIFGRSSNSTWK